MMTIEAELNRLFFGLDAGLRSVRAVQAAYDEQIAFNFNMLQFFNPGETKVSEILAFFLNPRATHAQKTAFLGLFLEHFQLSDNVDALLRSDEQIAVKPEFPTKGGRYIDIVIEFKASNFFVGVENKLHAEDQEAQLLDYNNDLRERSSGNYKLLYLSIDRERPSESSLPTAELHALTNTKTLQIITYKDIVALLAKYETVCRADNVREFIRQFQHYLRNNYLGLSSMGESNYISGYLRNHPDFIEHTDAIQEAVDNIRNDYFGRYWQYVSRFLAHEGVTLDPSKLAFVERSWKGAPVAPFAPSGELIEMQAIYEPSQKTTPIYISIRLEGKRSGMSGKSNERIKLLDSRLKHEFGELVNAGDNWCGAVPLEQINFYHSGDLARVARDESRLEQTAANAAKRIKSYKEIVDRAWKEIQLAS